jgi:hypothetical protein
MTYQGEVRRPAPEGGGGDGCLAAAIRLPVRVVAFVVVLPLRLLWDLLAAVGRAGRTGFLWVWRNVLAPPLAFVWRYLVVWPLATLYRYVLVPLGKALAFLWRYLVVWPLAALWRYVLAPIGRVLILPVARALVTAAAFLVHYLLVVPLGFLWRYVLVPVAREVGAALALAWRGTAYVSRAVGRAIGWVFRVLVAVPVAFVWNLTLGPVLRWCVRAVLRPAAEAVAEVRRTVRRVLLGAPAHRPPPVPPHRTPVPPPAAHRLDPRKDFGRDDGDGGGRTPPAHQ